MRISLDLNPIRISFAISEYSIYILKGSLHANPGR